MSPPSTPAFWAALDRRVLQLARRIARPVRGVLQAPADGAGPGLIGRILARADEDVSDVEVAQHYGFRSVAPAGVEVVAVPVGGSTAHLVIVGEIDRATAPQTLQAGEVAVYNATASVVLKLDGTIIINGGTDGVARVGDFCARSAMMTTWIGAVSGYINGLVPGSVVPPTDSDTIATGSATVRAG